MKEQTIEWTDRSQAKFCFRLSLVIFAIPAFYNWYCFGALRLGDVPFNPFPTLLDYWNGILLCGGLFCLWQYGFRALDFLTGGAHAVFSKKPTLNEWKWVTDNAVRRFPLFALAGAWLWGVWLYYIYWDRSDFLRTSIVIGGLGHLTAAVWYIPVFIGWYRMETQDQDDARPTRKLDRPE